MFSLKGGQKTSCITGCEVKYMAFPDHGSLRFSTPLFSPKKSQLGCFLHHKFGSEIPARNKPTATVPENWWLGDDPFGKAGSANHLQAFPRVTYEVPRSMIQSSEGRFKYLPLLKQFRNPSWGMSTKYQKKIKTHTHLKNQEMAEEIQPKWGEKVGGSDFPNHWLARKGRR